MTAEEKAKYLVEKFTNEIYPPKDTNYQAKRCALICVDEMIKHLVDTFIPNSAAIMAKDDKDICYWQAVKSEIENM